MGEPLIVERATLTVEEAAALLGIGRSAAYEAVRRGEIPSLKLGHRLVVPKLALQRCLSGEMSEPQNTGEEEAGGDERRIGQLKRKEVAPRRPSDPRRRGGRR